eukprot:jgi/Chrzof1/1630/Cz10g15020.t1
MYQQAVPGARETVTWLRKHHVPYKFVTNTTTKSAAGIAGMLKDAGIQCVHDDIITPASLASQYVTAHRLSPAAMFVAPDLLPDFSDIAQVPEGAESGAAAVVIGDMGNSLSAAVLNRALRLLMETPQPALISLGKTRYYKGPDGYNLDVGPITTALEFATGVTSIVLGKPAAITFQAAAAALGLPPDDVIMVGDDVISDVQGAKQAGLTGVLVRTGKYRPSDEEAGVADFVLQSIADLPDWLTNR